MSMALPELNYRPKSPFTSSGWKSNLWARRPIAHKFRLISYFVDKATWSLGIVVFEFGSGREAADDAEQLVGVYGLGDVDGEARGERALAVFVHRVAGERDGGDGFEPRHPAQLGEQRVAVNAGHADVGDDEAGRPLARAPDGLGRRARAEDLIALPPEEHL